MPLRSQNLARRCRLGSAPALALLLAGAAAAQQAAPPEPARGAPREGKLLLTGGVSTIDGAAGGGLTPWAVTGSYATDGQLGASAYLTRVHTSDYRLTGYGAGFSYSDRIELSLARQDFDTRDNVAPLGFPGLRLKQTIVGAKLRVAGDAVLDSDGLMPQIAVGLLHKRLDTERAFEDVLASLGAKDSGTDVYVSATKLFLAQGVLLNATLRATKANQNGLLGFGATGKDRYKLQPEVSLAYLINRRLAVGAEYRVKPDNLNPSPFGAGLKEDDWWDLFVAWAPSKNFSLTLAYVDLGRIVPALVPKRQQGAYLSAQLAF